MQTSRLPQKIADLVDHLRRQENQNISITDIASVTEVLISTMEAYFQSIDTSIYDECRSISEFIDNAKVEIASITPKGMPGEKLPRAGMELDAIVQHTEEATNTIMESAETIMNEINKGEGKTDTDALQDPVMQIFEACSFQDITGQRISKVVETLNLIEERVEKLRKMLGMSDDELAAHLEKNKAEAKDERTPDEGPRAEGPALEGEGIDQSAVDELLSSGGETAGTGAKVPDKKTEQPATAKAAPQPAKKQAGGGSASPAPAKAEKPDTGKKADAEEKADEAKDGAGGTSSQEDIDALFG